MTVAINLTGSGGKGFGMAGRSFGFGARSGAFLRGRGNSLRRNAQGTRGRAVRVPLALLVATVAVSSASLALGAGPAGASSPCVAYANCAPSNINFEQPGSVPLSNFNGQYCGIVGSYAPLADKAFDTTYDDPLVLDNNSEGNYTDSEAVDFKPATGLTGGDYVKVTLPHPAETYAGGGAILPQPKKASGESSEQLNSTLTIDSGENDNSFSTGSGNGFWEYPNNATTPSTFNFYVEVFAAGLGGGSTVDLAGLDPSQRQYLVFSPTANVGGV